MMIRMLTPLPIERSVIIQRHCDPLIRVAIFSDTDRAETVVALLNFERENQLELVPTERMKFPPVTEGTLFFEYLPKPLPTPGEMEIDNNPEKR